MNVLIYGSGQLARMMYLAGCPLGIYTSSVDVAKEQVVHPVSKTPLGISLEQAIEDADAITVEFEHIPEKLLALAEQSGKLKPSLEAILTGADRVREKRLLETLGVDNCQHTIIHHIDQIPDAMEKLGKRVILKSSRDGYDGYGQWRIECEENMPTVHTDIAKLDLETMPLIAEKMMSFDRELSLVGARTESGNITFYPLVENRHHQGQLHLTIAPAPQVSATLQKQAQDAFTKLADALNYIGILAVEFFQVGERLLVNEIAPRVHNSGHWTMQGADTCQFENHLRAVCHLPIGNTNTATKSAMVNIIGVGSFSRTMLGIPCCHLHWYGKESRPKRKLGHFNLNAGSYSQLATRLESLTQHLASHDFPLLHQAVEELKAL